MKRLQTRTKLNIGIYSEGTLRPLDLCGAFAYELASLRLSRRERATIRDILKKLEIENNKPYTERDGYAPYFQDVYYEDMIDIINRHCPKTAYFGSSEGDGACIGIWEYTGEEY